MAQLELIHSKVTSQTTPNVVFLHGLGGHPRNTWMYKPEDEAMLWPKWIGEDANCVIWVLGYDAALSSWTNGAMPLPDQGSTVLDLLVNEPALSNRPLVLIGHSMGGLVIKTALVNAMTHGVKRYEAIAKRLCGVVFIATPHFGSDLANLAVVLRTMLRTNEQVGNMKLHDAHLRGLNEQFRAQHRTFGFSVRTFAETQGVFIGRKVLGISFGSRVVVVDPSSSDPHVPGETVVRLPEDHFSICKPVDRNSQIHKSVVGFLRELPTTELYQQSLSKTVSPSTAETSPAEAIAGPIFSKPHPTELAFAEMGFEDELSPIIVTVYLISDEPQQLANEINSWRQRIARDPLVPEVERKRISGEGLVALFSETSVRAQLLGWLAVTSFSAYVYYGRRSEMLSIHLTREDFEQLFIVEPLVHRLSKKSEVIKVVHGNRSNLPSLIEQASHSVLNKFGREITCPEVTQNKSLNNRELSDLAKLVATAVAMHLASPNNNDDAVLFEHIRTRIRFAENVATGEKHTRDKNPMP